MFIIGAKEGSLAKKEGWGKYKGRIITNINGERCSSYDEAVECMQALGKETKKNDCNVSFVFNTMD